MLNRPKYPEHEAQQRGSAFTGTLGMLRLYLRRDRVVLPLWVFLLSLPLSTVYVGSIEKVYPDQAARAAFAATIMASPAQRALYGQIYNDSLGATGRDVGAGLIAERAGPAGATPTLRGSLGLAWRLDRGALLLWTVGLCLYGLLIGSVVHGIGDELGGGTAQDIVARMGGTSAVEQAFIAVGFCMLGMMASAFAISLTLRPYQEEASQRAETVLGGAGGRSRWLAGHLAVALVGSAVAMLIAGSAAGLTYGVAAHDIGGKLSFAIATAAVQLPAVWLSAAVTVALFGLAPRFSALSWGVLVGFVARYLIGSLSGFPQWLLDLEPFAHIPRVTGGAFTPVPLLWLLVTDAALTALGMAAFRRRDV
ncbi:hypothetical protein [Candidatus Mycobacterium methanotrophicum]|uniref:ABC transporter permease n=1 Tax=Candidatus Mycobacterium methanotrophicum TaxID=2943498 RepID=A0ABY4QIR3_9MYCO|nr:hypothetical protein [Candidatus Mycobacterium methanotrophicum]UQX09711.1 hypothetical protein M5I08_15490 [Candidatus Mycobacterium methanotrophicum]